MASETRTRLFEDMKTSLKAGDKFSLNVIRMLISEIKKAETDDPKEPQRERTEQEVIAICAGYHKSIAKVMPEFPPDRQEIMKAELAVVERYLPSRLTIEEIKSAISLELKTNPERNFGILMKHFQPKFAMQADGKLISEALKTALAEL